MGIDSGARSFAVDLAREAGEIIRSNFKLGMNKTWKGDNSPLTATDIAVNDLVIRSVAQRYPDHAIIGEEASSVEEEPREWAWVCDPIDGTLPFSHGCPTFVFSLGLAYRGESVLGVIYDPMLDRLLVGEKGKGVSLNGKPAKVSDAEDMDTLVVDLEASHFHPVEGGRTRLALKEKGAHVVSLYSVVYGGMLVAAGELAAAMCTNGRQWDGCALDVIVTEAGGHMTDLQGHALRYDKPISGFVASNGQVHASVLEAIALEYP